MPSSRLDPPVAQRKSSALRTRVLRRFDSCREVHGGVIGPATEPVLKTVRAFEGVGIDTSPTPPIRKVNRSGNRHRLESDRVVRHCGSRPRPSSTTAPPFIPPPLAGQGRVGAHGCLTRAASGARSKRDGTTRCGDRHVRHPPFQHSADRGSTGSKRGSEKPSRHLRG